MWEGYKEILSGISPGGKDVKVEPLILAIERQATLTNQLGGFMQLIVQLDEGNMRTVCTQRGSHPRTSHTLPAANALLLAPCGRRSLPATRQLSL